MMTHRQRIGGMRKTAVSALEAHARAGEQLAAPGRVDVSSQQTWVAQAQLLLVLASSLTGSDKGKKILAEKGWHAPVVTDQDRAAEIAKDSAALREAVAVLRTDDADAEHKLACIDVEQLLYSFEAVIRRLAKRRDKREPFLVRDEFDLQYMLHALLVVHFPDVRMEGAVASVAGSNSRIDFFLKPDKIAIEAKATREGLDDQELGRQLLEDLAKYKGHSGVKTLFFFIWDPEHHVRNAAGIRGDLLAEAGDRRVYTIFSPPRR